MSWLDLCAISKRYNPGAAGEVLAVDEMSLAVGKGEIVALLGSSGCGKTSTLRMIAGFESVSGGRIVLDGREIQALAPARRNVAMAFEGYSLYPPLSVRDNIAFALKSQRLSPSLVDERVREVAHLVEIEDILDRYPGSISGGQQQRASLARALIRDADLHLLDEPMGQLEPQLRALLRGRIKHFVKERGLTAILVTHDQTEANALADRIAVMEEGVLQQFDRPETLKNAPANLFTGTFIGEPPMNVFAAAARFEAGDVVFELDDGVTLRYPQTEFSEPFVRTLHAHRRLTLGVRPHAVRIRDHGVAAVVSVNQWLGDQTHIAARFAGDTIVSVAHDRVELARGAQVRFEIAARDLHLFDRRSGAALGEAR